MDIGKPKWSIDSVLVDEKIYIVSDEIKGLQRNGCSWGSISNGWIEVRNHEDVAKIEIIARNTKRNVFKRDSFVIYLNEDSITGVIDVVREGDWDDVIGLSEENVVFTKDGGTKEINTIYHSWWIERVHIGDKSVEVDLDDKAQLINKLRFKKTYDWLTIEVLGRKIRLTVLPNSSNQKRTFKIDFMSGNFFASLSGEQNK